MRRDGRHVCAAPIVVSVVMTLDRGGQATSVNIASRAVLPNPCLARPSTTATAFLATSRPTPAMKPPLCMPEPSAKRPPPRNPAIAATRSSGAEASPDSTGYPGPIPTDVPPAPQPSPTTLEDGAGISPPIRYSRRQAAQDSIVAALEDRESPPLDGISLSERSHESRYCTRAEQQSRLVGE